MLLPDALPVCGRAYPIDADFRNVLRIFQAFADDALTPEEKAYICVLRLYKEPIGAEAYEEAVRQAFWFCDGGDVPKSQESPVRTMDWEQDAHMLFPAVNRAAGFEVRSCAFLHWWTFLGLFGEISEGLFSTVLHIRQKRANHKKLTDSEREFCRKNRGLVELRTVKEREEIRETEDFLKTIT